MESGHRILALDHGWLVARVIAEGDAQGEQGRPVLPSEDSLQWIDATVPGAVHYDLMAAGMLENPFSSSDAARSAKWVAESDWLYRIPIDEPDIAELNWADIWLEFLGIDTFADIWLNDRYVGSTANANRSYRFAIGNTNDAGDRNKLFVRVKAHGRMILSKIPGAARMGRTGPVTGQLGKSLIRRYQRNFYTGSSLLNLGTGSSE